MPERFKVVCVPCTAQYQCLALSFYYQHGMIGSAVDSIRSDRKKKEE